MHSQMNPQGEDLLSLLVTAPLPQPTYSLLDSVLDQPVVSGFLAEVLDAPVVSAPLPAPTYTVEQFSKDLLKQLVKYALTECGSSPEDALYYAEKQMTNIDAAKVFETHADLRSQGDFRICVCLSRRCRIGPFLTIPVR